ncbi:MAG: hypothetical protein ACOCT8_00345 [Actinomycetota bacterium]
MVDTHWLEPEEPPGSPHPRRRVGLAVLATIPWLLVVGLLVGPRLGDDAAPEQATTSAPSTEDAAPEADADDEASVAAGSAQPGELDPGEVEPDHDSGSPPAAPEQAPSDGGSGGTVEIVPSPRDPAEPAAGWRVIAGAEEAASLGVAVARAALTSIDPVLTIDGVELTDTDTYAEHLVVEAVERTGPTAATVTVLAVVLHEGAESDPEVRRLAVPITFDAEGPHPAGTPWELPAPSLEPRPQQLTPVDDPDQQLRAVEALAEAGLDELELLGLRTAEGGPAAAEVRGPDGEEHQVWLRHHLDGFVVAGIPLPDERLETPADGEPRATTQGARP